MSGIDGNQILEIMKNLKVPCTPKQIAFHLAKKKQKTCSDVIDDVLVTLMSGVRFGYIECIHKKYYKIKDPKVLFNLLDLRKEGERRVAPKKENKPKKESKPKKKSVKKRKTPAKGRKRKRCKQCDNEFDEDTDTDATDETTTDEPKRNECTCQTTNEDANQCCCLVEDNENISPQQNNCQSDTSRLNQNIQTSESKISIVLQCSSEHAARKNSANCCSTRSCKYCACRAECNEVEAFKQQSRKRAAEWSQHISDHTRKLAEYYRSIGDIFGHGSPLQKDSDVVAKKSNTSMTNQHLQKSENSVYTSYHNPSEFQHSDEGDNTSDSH